MSWRIESGSGAFHPAAILLALVAPFLPMGCATTSGPTPGPAPASAPIAVSLRCLKLAAAPASLPAQLPVGVETIHRDAEKIITIEVPLAPIGAPSRVLDTNAKKPNEHLPKKFVISDGTIRAAFIGVDRSPGSRLDACVAELKDAAHASGPDELLPFIRDHLQDYLKAPEEKSFRFFWDPLPAPKPAELSELFLAAKDMGAGHYPLRSRQLHPVVPLEKFLEAGYGTCLHKAILASLLLERAGIAHRLVNGATRAGGHTWIELQDGRILDPSLNRLERAAPSQALPGWIRYGDNLVFENQVWPYLAL